MTNWLKFWNTKAEESNNLKQVGRTINGKAISSDLLNQIALDIVAIQKIKNTDDVLDVCCGNGTLSCKVADHCNSLTGIDFSDNLLDFAANNNADIHIKYFKENALDFSLNTTFDKVFLYFSFQYFESFEEGKKVIENCLKHVKPGGSLLIGDIPDFNKKFTFYNTPAKIFSLIKQNITQTNTMGKFWRKTELDKICKQLKVNGKYLPQKSWQPYHHYRFDYLISI